MKTDTPKQPRLDNPKPAVKKSPSKPKKKTSLSKSDPDYYAKIGAISAAKRKLSSKAMSDMARLSHRPGARPNGYVGGRPKSKPEDAAE